MGERVCARVRVHVRVHVHVHVHKGASQLWNSSLILSQVEGYQGSGLCILLMDKPRERREPLGYSHLRTQNTEIA